MAINPNSRIGTRSFLTGITPKNGGKQLPKVASEIAENGKMVAQDALDGSLATRMSDGLKPLSSELAARKLPLGQQRAALMAAGALVAGSTGVVITSMANQLSEATSTSEGTKKLADKALSEVKVGGIQEGQLTSLGNQVTSALTADGVKPNNVPTALFIGGAMKDAEVGLNPSKPAPSPPSSEPVGYLTLDDLKS